MKLKKCMTILFLLIIVLGITGLPINAEDVETTVSFTNNIDSSLVAITLNQSKEFPGSHQIVPNEIVHDSYSITNNVEPVWIRCKVLYEYQGEISLYPNENLILNHDDWIEKKGYWYYRYPLENKKSVTFLSGERMLGQWTNEDVKKNFQLHINADAVQTAHFTPDLTEDDPWFGTIVEYSYYDHAELSDGGNTNFEVRYLGGAQGLVKRGDDLFSNWKNVMPGDILSDQVVIGNEYQVPVVLYFRIDQTDEDKMADHTLLKIWAGTDLIYDGTMAGAKYEQKLAVFEPQDSAVLRFEVRIPERLDNPYALNHADQKWIFRAGLTKVPTTNRRRVSPNTAAGKNVVLYVIAASGAFLLTLIFIVLYRRLNHEKTKEDD